MSEEPVRRHEDVQYIATSDFMRTLLSNTDDVPPGILDTLYDRYDFMIDPGMEEEHPQGSDHRAERDFRREYKHNEDRIKRRTRRLAAGKGLPRSKGRKIPFYLIAMALHRSRQGKPRVILTDDPGLIEWLQFYDIDVMTSRDFIEKMKKDRLISDEQAKKLSQNVKDTRGKEPFSREKFETIRMAADRLHKQRERQRPEQGLEQNIDSDQYDADQYDSDQYDSDQQDGDSQGGKSRGQLDVDF